MGKVDMCIKSSLFTHKFRKYQETIYGSFVMLLCFLISFIKSAFSCGILYRDEEPLAEYSCLMDWNNHVLFLSLLSTVIGVKSLNLCSLVYVSMK